MDFFCIFYFEGSFPQHLKANLYTYKSYNINVLILIKGVLNRLVCRNNVTCLMKLLDFFGWIFFKNDLE